MQTAYVVDTTVLVSWLLNPNKLTGKIVRSLELELYTPYKAVSELWKHQSDWRRRKPSINLHEFLNAIQYYIRVVMVDLDSQEAKRARAIMNTIDPDDSEFLALALKINVPIWSHDKHFEKQNLVQVVKSRDILAKSREIPTLWMALKED